MQRYVSKELTHFVGGNLSKHGKKSEGEQFALLVKILKSGLLTSDPANPTMARRLVIDPQGKISDETMHSTGFVCFCDIPVEDLAIHMNKYSWFGLSFQKQFLLQKGANPVFYVSMNSMVSSIERPHRISRLKQFDTWIGKVHRLFIEMEKSIDYGDITDLNLVIKREDSSAHGISIKAVDLLFTYQFLKENIFCFQKPFEDETIEDSIKNYYMEREWRIHGYFLFNLKDVHRVIIPQEYSKRLRDELPDYYGQITFVDSG